jgi:hypothetical protein
MSSITNPIKYTSRTFQSIINDINSDSELAVKPNWWKRLWAGIGDVLSIWLNSMINLVFLRTSYTRSAVADLCELIDYYLSPQSTSSGKVLFYVNTSLGGAIFPFTVLKANLQARSQGSLTISSKIFQSRTTEVFSLIAGLVIANPGTEEITTFADLQYTGHKVRFTTSGTLPAPLQLNTDYFIIYINATTIKLALTLADAFAGNVIDITTAGTGNHTMTLYSKAVDLFQQETLPALITIGTSDGFTPWQEFDLPDKLVLVGTESIVINSVTWTKVTTFVNSVAIDKVYKIIPKSNGTFSIRFGNGVYGMIPSAFDVTAIYSYGGGSNSNIATLNRINTYAGGDPNITAVSNVTAFSGGNDEETIINAKRIAPLLLKSRDRFITSEDGVALVLNYGGVSQAKVVKNFYGVFTCKVLGIAFGGGQISAPLRTAIQQYLIDRTILESIDVHFDLAIITSINVTSALKVLGGYVYTGGIDKYFDLAYKLFLSETGNEIKNDYLSNGIESATTLINSIFSTFFFESDYTQIKKLLDKLIPIDFGMTIQQSDVFSYIQSNVDGIDYMTITTFGSGFPLVLASDEITTNGIFTLSEIP